MKLPKLTVEQWLGIATSLVFLLLALQLLRRALFVGGFVFNL